MHDSHTGIMVIYSYCFIYYT